MSTTSKQHWEQVYQRRVLSEVSWYELEPKKSLELIRASGIGRHDPIIDVGGGGSYLVDALLREGYTDVTVLDISSEVLQKVRDRLGQSAPGVTLAESDVTEFQPPRSYALWHDRAVFHFLIDAEARERYRGVLRRALRPGGQVVISTFGPQGPERCSGLPVQRYSETTLAMELGDAFRSLESSIDIHHTPSGHSQQFLHQRFESVRSD